MMTGMDKLFSTCGFNFLHPEELIAELPAEQTLWDAPAFDRVLYYADPSGIAVTAMEYEGEWTIVPSFRGGEDSEATLYRAMPFIGILEVESLRLAVLSNAPFTLPTGNPVGGEKLRGRVRPAVVALEYEVTETAAFSLRSPATERFYQNYKPSLLNPQAELAGTVNNVEKKTNEFGGGEFWVCEIDGLPLIVDAPVEAGQGVRAHGIALCATEYWD
ncbi:hypothetical protein GWO62_08330 [Corynebacterium macginleyi]|nr:hypothetical protein [Corynebacterium macginleyi]